MGRPSSAARRQPSAAITSRIAEVVDSLGRVVGEPGCGGDAGLHRHRRRHHLLRDQLVEGNWNNELTVLPCRCRSSTSAWCSDRASCCCFCYGILANRLGRAAAHASRQQRAPRQPKPVAVGRCLPRWLSSSCCAGSFRRVLRACARKVVPLLYALLLTTFGAVWGPASAIHRKASCLSFISGVEPSSSSPCRSSFLLGSCCRTAGSASASSTSRERFRLFARRDGDRHGRVLPDVRGRVGLRACRHGGDRIAGGSGHGGARLQAPLHRLAARGRGNARACSCRCRFPSSCSPSCRARQCASFGLAGSYRLSSPPSFFPLVCTGTGKSTGCDNGSVRASRAEIRQAFQAGGASEPLTPVISSGAFWSGLFIPIVAAPVAYVRPVVSIASIATSHGATRRDAAAARQSSAVVDADDRATGALAGW